MASKRPPRAAGPAPVSITAERGGWMTLALGALAALVSAASIGLPIMAFAFLLIALWLVWASTRAVREARDASADSTLGFFAVLPPLAPAAVAGLLAVIGGFGAVYLSLLNASLVPDRAHSGLDVLFGTAVLFFAGPTLVVLALFPLIDLVITSTIGRTPWAAAIATISAAIAGYGPMLVWIAIAAPLNSPVLAILAPAVGTILVTGFGVRTGASRRGSR